MRKRILFSLLLCGGLFVLGLAGRTALNQTSKRPAYTIVWVETSYDSAGKGTPESVETRYVSASGNSYSVKQYADGKTEEMIAIVGKGNYLKRGQKLHFLSESTPIPPRTADAMKSKNRYLRSETVLGLPTVVISPPNDLSGNFELFFAPALNSEIKTVFRGARTIVKEPVSLTFGEPDPQLFKFPEGLPVDYTNYERLHGPRKQ